MSEQPVSEARVSRERRKREWFMGISWGLLRTKQAPCHIENQP
jgi:hypothetical protein